MRVFPADADLATRLDVDTDSAIVSRSFVRVVDGEPPSLQDSYYAMDVAQECGLVTPHGISGGTIRAMADRGYVEVGYVDELTARMPTPAETRRSDSARDRRCWSTSEPPTRKTHRCGPPSRSLPPTGNGSSTKMGDLTAFHGDAE